MRILFVQRHFWPDVPTYAHLTKDIAVQLAADGHDVTVLSATPSYNAAYSGPAPPLQETIDDVEVVRVRMPRERSRRTRHRLLDTSGFLIRVSSHLLRHRSDYDLVLTTNAPAVFLPAVVRLLTRLTRTNYVYHCQDLQPEAGIVGGVISDSAGTRVLTRVDRRSCADAAAVVVLSRDMHDSLVGRNLSGRNIHVINNFIIEPADREPETRTPLARGEGVFQIVFAGNMGRFQGLDRVIEAARLLSADPNIRFVFVGSGSEMGALERQAGSIAGTSVVFLTQQSLPDTMALLGDSHLGLVPLVPGMYRVAYPSKIMAYVEAGCRLVLLMECDSEAAQTIARLDLGTCCASSDPRSIADAILNEYRRFQEPGDDRDRIRSTGRELFSKERILPEWSRLLRALERQITSPAIDPQADDSPQQIGIRTASEDDIDRIVDIHIAAFPGSTMTRLGPGFLRKYYATVLAYPEHVFLVAEKENRLGAIGFVAGFKDVAAFYTAFRRRRWVLGLAALPQLLRHPRLVLDIRGGSQWSVDRAASDAANVVELASIAVHPAEGGRGIGSSLVEEFAARCRSMAVSAVVLTTDAVDGNKARAFYEHLGFRADKTFRRGMDRPMVEYRLYLGDSDA